MRNKCLYLYYLSGPQKKNFFFFLHWHFLNEYCSDCCLGCLDLIKKKKSLVLGSYPAMPGDNSASIMWELLVFILGDHIWSEDGTQASHMQSMCSYRRIFLSVDIYYQENVTSLTLSNVGIYCKENVIFLTLSNVLGPSYLKKNFF